MIRIERYGDVERLGMSSRVSRAIGFEVSAYVIRGLLVDTGIPTATTDLLRLLDERQAAGRPIRGAVITHQHEDHAGNVEALARRGVPLAMSAATLDAVRDVAPTRPYRRLAWGRMPSLRTPHVPLDPSPLVLLPAPGHSADHHVVWDPETGTLFGGDLFLGVVVRVAHDDEDPRALARSLRAAAALRPARFFDGHRGPVPDAVDALLAKAAWLEETVGEIERRAAAGEGVAEITRAVLGGESLIGAASLGHYSRRAFVRATLNSGTAGERGGGSGERELPNRPSSPA